MVLRPLLFLFGNLASVAALQHLLGLAMGVAIYVLLRRRGARPWLAAVATMPVLLNAYQIQIEQNVLAETLFEVLIVAGVVALLWNPEPKLTALIASGIVLGMAVTVRTVGLPLVLPAAVYAAAAGPRGWGRVVRSVVLAARSSPSRVYVGYYHHWSHRIGLTTADAAVLAGRAEVIVDCHSLSLPSYEQVLCPTEPLGHRQGTDEYAHDAQTPISRARPAARADRATKCCGTSHVACLRAPAVRPRKGGLRRLREELRRVADDLARGPTREPLAVPAVLSVVPRHERRRDVRRARRRWALSRASAHDVPA